jgi:hypothetical protein
MGCTGQTQDSAEPDAPDLTERLGVGQARAGLMLSDAAGMGGMAAEGQAGDFKIYNDRVQFIIQGHRPGHYLAHRSGGVVDADIVRSEGQPGRDYVDDWMPMAGVGHLMEAERIEVLDDGCESGVAVVQVEGDEAPFTYIQGATESDSIVQDLGLHFVTTYTLPAGSWLMDVETVISAERGFVATPVGDVIQAGKEGHSTWTPGVGREQGLPDAYDWAAFTGDRNEQAVAVLAAEGEHFESNLAVDVMHGLIAITSAYTATLEIDPDVPVTRNRYYGVAPDLATLTDAWLATTAVETETLSETVTAPDGPVEGARVTVLVDGDPFTMAVTGADGAFEAQVPVGSEVELAVDGRGNGIHPDIAAGGAPHGPYGPEWAREEAMTSWTDGAEPIAMAAGRGVGSADAPLELAEPGWVELLADDGIPFEARLSLSGDSSLSSALYQSRPSGYTALAWSRDGEMSLPLEPGEYSVLVHRGARWEIHQSDFTVVAGETTTVEISLDEAWENDGWLVADPHMHAAPSPDGGIPMVDRTLVAAGVGIQLMFGTEHDHVADYGPLVEALGLSDVMNPITATEISPLLRGHYNLFPIEPTEGASNRLDWIWWEQDWVDTESTIADLRDAHPESVVQVNHPLSGLASFAQWSEGEIGRPDYWTEDFDAIEVVNGGHSADTVDLYLDLVNRGVVVAAHGVSDSHGYLSGGPGMNITYMGVGVSSATDITPEHVVDAVLERRTIVSTGPFLRCSIDPGSVLTGSAELEVEALTPSWFSVDRLMLLENGEVIETVEGTEAVFSMAPLSDAVYVVMAEGDQSMVPVRSSLPWAMTSAFLVDVEGDGWEPPLPALNTD